MRIKFAFFLGDFNLNLLDIHADQNVNSFLETVFSYSYVPLITKATRITQSSATLIDNAFVNSTNLVLKSGILLADISDHLPVFLLCKSNGREKSNEQMGYVRDMSQLNLDKFRDAITAHSWESVFRVTSCDNAYEVFLNEFNSIYNSCFPLKKKQQKNRKISKPWITPTILKSCKKKMKLYKKFLKNPSEYRKGVYQKYRNVLTTVIRKSREEYYSHQLEESNSSKQTWNIINTILKKDIRNKIEKCFCDDDNQTCTNSVDIAEKFNEFFINAGTRNANPHDINLRKCKSYMTGHYDQSMFLKPVEEHEIIDIVKSMKIGKSPGHDNITTFIVKETIQSIVAPLLYIFNLSFSTGIFPHSMKLAKVIPIHKKGPLDQFGNYRPVSLLPVFSKILEKLFYSRLISYVNKLGILSNFQYGFRSGHSTILAVTHYLDEILSSLDESKHSISF